MSTRLFFNVVIKSILIISIFSCISSLLSLYVGIINSLNSSFFVENPNSLISNLIAILLIVIQFVLQIIIFLKSNYLIDKFKLLAGIEEETIAISITAKQLLQIVLIVILSYLLIENIVPLILSLYTIIKLRANYSLSYLIDNNYVNVNMSIKEVITSIICVAVIIKNDLVVNYLIKE